MNTHELVNRHRIKADVEYGASKPNSDQNWPCNDWRVTLKFGRRHITTDFYTGLGISGEPEADDVLDSLLLDASYADQNFDDFCNDLGYDTDSRRAESQYKACVRTERKLRQFLNGHYDEFMQAERL